MVVLAAALTLVLFLAPAAALSAAAARRPAAALLGLAAVALAVLTLRGLGEQAELTVTHAFAAFVGSDIVSKDFVIERATAPAWQWPALCLLWVLPWLALALRRPGPQGPPLTGPLCLAWGGSALLLALQKLAAPAPLALGLDLPPLPPFEVAVWPALVAAALRLAASTDRVLTLLTFLSIATLLAHLPLAIFGTLATHRELGTYLDVHTIDHIANPFTQMSTPLHPKSHQQLAWLVWTPQLIMWPAFSMLSAGGIGFAALMVKK